MTDVYTGVVSAVLCLFLARSSDVKVEVTQGTLVGTRHVSVFDGRSYFAFYGVQYARPPDGKLRFRDPKEPRKWKRSFDATIEHRGACAQAHIVHRHGVYGYEDCLRLNIYTPSVHKDGMAERAVIVWVHGYGFTSSFSHIYGGDFFIENNVILITLTHRIGPFGFLIINETSGDANMGLKDIVVALKWIKRNVKVFGGDRNKITVMGSGSAVTFLSLLVTTKFNKLFAKMILQSGSIYSPSVFLGDHALELSRLQETLAQNGVKDIRKSSANDIIAAAQKIYSREEIIKHQRPLIPFLPTLEKKSNLSLLTKNQHNINNWRSKPILIGFNSQESISEIIPFLQNPQLLKTLAISFKFMVPFAAGCQLHSTSRVYNHVADKIRAKYFKNGITVESFLRYTTDLYVYPIYRFMKELVNVNDNVYAYKFNYNGNFNVVKTTSLAGVNVKVKGASNGDELCYLFKCEPFWENYVKIYRDLNNRDRKFIKQITELWSNFAKTGSPTPRDYRTNITWPVFTAAKDSLLSIGREFKVVNGKSEKTMFAFWNEIYKQYYSPEHCDNKHDEL